MYKSKLTWWCGWFCTTNWNQLRVRSTYNFHLTSTTFTWRREKYFEIIFQKRKYERTDFTLESSSDSGMTENANRWMSKAKDLLTVRVVGFINGGLGPAPAGNKPRHFIPTQALPTCFFALDEAGGNFWWSPPLW